MVLRSLSAITLIGCIAAVTCVPLSLLNVYHSNTHPNTRFLEFMKFKERNGFEKPSLEEQGALLRNANAASLKLNLVVYPKYVGFYLYTRNNNKMPTRVYLNDPDSLKAAGYNTSVKTKFIIHGFLGSLTSDMIQSIKNNLLALPDEDMNVIAVDWSVYTFFYVNVYEHTMSVGSLIGEFIQYLEQHGTSKHEIHCIGHSLGAHVCGFAGQKINGSIARITGLDPAQPGFNIRDTNARLNSNDAMFVDCIHTCGGGLGVTDPICSADFYPNSGTCKQPGCPWWDVFGICSHGRSHEFFAESILPGQTFYAVSCASLNFLSKDCVYQGAVMGYPAKPQYTGIFYLQTKDSSPFAYNWTAVLF